MTNHSNDNSDLTPIEPDMIDVYDSNSNMLEFFPPVKKGTHSRRAAITGKFLSWGDADVDNIEELENRAMQYLQFCFDNDLRITNQAMYFAIGVDRRLLEKWMRGESGSQAQIRFARKVQTLCAVNREMMMVDGSMNFVPGIFWQKNYDGMTDQPREVTEQRDPFEEVANLDELQDKYLIESGFDRTEMIKSHEQREKTVDRYEKRKKDRLRRVREAHENEEIDSDWP